MSRYQNKLLQMLGDDAGTLRDVVTIALPTRQRLDDDEFGTFAYFLEDGVASVVGDVDGKLAVELGIIGRDGVVGLDVVYGDPESPYQTVMQVEGSGLRVPKAELARLLEQSTAARALLLRFARTFSIQVASTAIANGRHKLDERLARWLLMVADRAGPTFAITHEYISVMLAVRRSGVTIAMQVLEGRGLIRASRGSITVLDRPGLVAAAKGAYGFAELHYERLLGAMH